MSIILTVNGKQYDNFINATVEKRMDALCDTFTFQLSIPEGEVLPFTGGEACQVFVNNQLALTGNIEIVGVDYNADNHLITISGRDKTGDLLDSTLDIISDLKASSNLTLQAIIEKVISSLGLDITVSTQATIEPFNKAEDVVSPEPGQNAFEFIERYARKRQVLLRSDADGNVVITSPTNTVVNSPLRNIFNFNGNNIKRGSVSYDSTGRYRFYKFGSSANPSAFNFAGEVTVAQAVDQKGFTTDKEVKRARTLILTAEVPMSNEQCAKRAQWEANVRKAKSRVFSATVQGFNNLTGVLWDFNTLVSVVDNFTNIDATMLINTVNFTYSLTEGSLTTLGLLNRKAYTLELSEPVTEKVGDGLFS